MINFVYRNKIYYVTHNGLQMLIYNEHKEEISFPCDELWQLAYNILNTNMEDHMNWINEIINLARTYRGLEEPEIGINENTQTIALFDYQEANGAAVHKIDICPIRVVNLENLRKELDAQGIAYTL